MKRNSQEGDYLGLRFEDRRACRDLLARGTLVDAHSYDELAVELPEGGVFVDLDHDGQAVGRLIYGQIAEDGRLNCVAVLDDDRIRQVEQDVFWSPRFVMVGDVRRRSYIARQAELLGLSLTLAPRRWGPAPIGWREGDVRQAGDRSRWPISWRGSDPLLERAAEAVAGGWRLRSRGTERLVDLRPSLDTYPLGLKPGDRVPPGWGTRVLPNGLWRSAHRGRILDVR